MPDSVIGRFSGPALAGLVMIYASLALIIYMIYRYPLFIEPITFAAINIEADRGVLVIPSLIAMPFCLLLFSLFTFYLGYRLISSSGVTTGSVLPVQDRDLLAPLIRDANEHGVRLYLDLTNTKGITGNFTKLGITGLPLATIFLTCFFSSMSILDNPHQSTFLDLAKLTLGAFIGSFVQRQAERDRAKGQTLPSDNSSNSTSPLVGTAAVKSPSTTTEAEQPMPAPIEDKMVLSDRTGFADTSEAEQKK